MAKRTRSNPKFSSSPTLPTKCPQDSCQEVGLEGENGGLALVHGA